MSITILILSRLHPIFRRAAMLVISLGPLSALTACGDSDSGRPTGSQQIPVASVRIAPLDGALLVGTEHALHASPLSATGTALLNRPVTWASDNHIVATVSATGVVTARAAGTVGISASSEGKTSRIEVRIVSPNPIPIIAIVLPSSIAAGSAGPLHVDVTGTGFTDGTRLLLEGIEQTTERIDVTTLRMTLPTGALVNAVTWSVTASTPAPGGGVSNVLALKVEAVAAPTITALDPRQITAGWGAAFTLTISGTGFTPRSAVSWDGTPRPTRYVDAATVQITIDPQDVRMARAVPVLVDTPSPGGGSAATTFTVHPIPVARVTVQSPWGFAWTWRDHRLPLTAVAEDLLGRELIDRRATWTVLDPLVATVVPVSEREVAVYGASAGETDVEAVVDGVRGRRTVRVHEAPAYEIVFEAGEGDDRHLMVWDLVTANAPRRLTLPMVAFSPAPSPDGREVAFAGVNRGAGPTGNVDIIIVARDGSTRRVASSPAFDADPAWSPDATKLAFTSSRAHGFLDIFIVDLASGVLTRLTDAGLIAGAPGSGSAARSPTWSPDGMQIAYTIQTATGSQLWVMATDGSNKRQLTSSADANDFDPVWSPDGSVIAFTREFRQPQTSVVMTVRPDGSQVMYIGGRVVNVAATPAYSPDGEWLTTAQTRGFGAGAIHAFSIAANAGPRIVMPEVLGGGRHARWMRRP